MMRSVLCALALSLFTLAANAQCTPDPLYADSTFGIWPNPDQGFPEAEVGAAYETVLQLKVPSDGGEIDPTYSGVGVHKLEIASVNNMPDGLSYDCDNVDCEWLGGQQGCIRIFGTPTETGTFTIEVVVTGYSTFAPTVPLVNYPFDGYSLTVVDSNTAVIGKSTPTFEVRKVTQQGSRVQVAYQSQQAGATTIQLFDLLGKPVATQTTNNGTGNNVAYLDVSAVPAGIYFVSVQQNGQRITKRLMLASH